MYFELEDADLALLMSRERRGGQVAIWSLVVIFLVPGLLDGSIALVTLGGALAVGATIATVRAFRRHVQPGAAARGLHHPVPHRLPPYRPCALPERGTGARWVTTARRPGARAARGLAARAPVSSQILPAPIGRAGPRHRDARSCRQGGVSVE